MDFSTPDFYVGEKEDQENKIFQLYSKDRAQLKADSELHIQSGTLKIGATTFTINADKLKLDSSGISLWKDVLKINDDTLTLFEKLTVKKTENSSLLYSYASQTEFDFSTRSVLKLKDLVTTASSISITSPNIIFKTTESMISSYITIDTNSIELDVNKEISFLNSLKMYTAQSGHKQISCLDGSSTSTTIGISNMSGDTTFPGPDSPVYWKLYKGLTWGNSINELNDMNADTYSFLYKKEGPGNGYKEKDTVLVDWSIYHKTDWEAVKLRKYIEHTGYDYATPMRVTPVGMIATQMYPFQLLFQAGPPSTEDKSVYKYAQTYTGIHCGGIIGVKDCSTPIVNSHIIVSNPLSAWGLVLSMTDEGYPIFYLVEKFSTTVFPIKNSFELIDI